MAVYRVYQTVSGAALYWCMYCSVQNTRVQCLAYVLENLGLYSWEKKKIFCPPKHPVPLWDPVSLLFNSCRTFFTRGYSDGQSCPHTHAHVVPRLRWVPLHLSHFPTMPIWRVQQQMEGRYSDFLSAGRSGVRNPEETRFSALFQTGPGTNPASYTMGTGSFPGVKRPGRGVEQPPPSSAEVKETVKLYFYFRSGPSFAVLGWTLPFQCLYLYSKERHWLTLITDRLILL